jgi:DNA-binding transcriptional MocR family regulator
MHTIWLPTLSDDGAPKYLALTRALREAIRAGILVEGTQLPTVRDLAYRLAVTPGTVSRAYQIATHEGLLEATVGRGTFVAASHPRLGPTQSLFIERDAWLAAGRVDLRAPRLPDVGQTAIFAQAMQRVCDGIGPKWLEYTRQSDEGPLRAAVVDWLSDRVLGPISASDIMLNHGGQNAIGLILNCCLRGDRPVVLTEDLSYPGFRYAARAARAEVVGVELDHEGLRPDALEAACRRHGPQVLCLTPETQNPTTARMGAQRRAEIVSIARKYDLHIIEDECYAPTQSDIPTLRALAPERVWFVGSLSKSVSAALRFGYTVCPAGMGEAGRLTAQHSFFALSLPVTALCLDLLQSGQGAEIRARVQQDLSERLQIMVNRLGAFDLSWQTGMPFGWLQLPQGWRASTFTRIAEDQGVLVRSADEYALFHGRAPNAVRLAVVGNVPRQQYEAGLATLAHLLPRPPQDMAV